MTFNTNVGLQRQWHGECVEGGHHKKVVMEPRLVDPWSVRSQAQAPRKTSVCPHPRPTPATLQYILTYQLRNQFLEHYNVVSSWVKPAKSSITRCWLQLFPLPMQRVPRLDAHGAAVSEDHFQEHPEDQLLAPGEPA